jgi:hypothetical protein
MSSTCKEYNQKTEKLKGYSKKSIYRKIRPPSIAKDIPDDYLTDAGYTKNQLISDLYKLIDCNSKISFIENKQKDPTGKIIDSRKQFDSNQCNIFTLCPVCAEKHGSRRRAKYKDPIKEMAKQHEYAYMITFTVRDEPTFNKAYENLTEGIRKYVLMGQLRGLDFKGEKTYSKGEAGKIKAMALSKEIIIGKNSNLFHVHAHAIAFCDEKIDYSVYNLENKIKIIEDYKKEYGRSPGKEMLLPAVEKWGEIEIINPDGEIEKIKVPVSKASKEWIKATNGLSSNIKFKTMKGCPDSIFKQCIEVIKYTSKVEEFNSTHIIEILANRKGKRFFATYGELYNNNNPMVEVEEEIETTGLKGYVWNNKEEIMVPMNNRENQYLNLKYQKKEYYYAAKAVMMKAYYVKEAIKFDIMKGYKNSKGAIEQLEKQLSVIKPGETRIRIENELKEVLKCQPKIKGTYVLRVDSLEESYSQFKKATFKKYMGLKLRQKDKMIVDNLNIDQMNFYNLTKGLRETKKIS